MAFGQQFQTLCSMSMRLCRIFQVSDWIAGQTVGAALQQDKFRFCLIEEYFRRFPCLEKELIVGTGRHRNIQFGTGSRTATGFFHSTGPGIEVAAIFVEIHKHKIRVVLEGVEHAIAVMCIDINVGDALNSILPAQCFDGDPAIVEHTKTGGGITARMVQTGDGYECLPATCADNIVQCREYRTYHRARSFKDSPKCRGVTGIEITEAGQRLLLYLLDVALLLKAQNLGFSGLYGFANIHLAVQTELLQTRPERIHTIRSERMSLTKTIGSQRCTDINR
ncbi:MAG: hypothetical protein BMS9Abin08_0773 [Gammaproteobacteria bacterium]|nr:MAG: hypothetical protein BMS9Abin08_0773 [Gammaproteobacteria bacterium]